MATSLQMPAACSQRSRFLAPFELLALFFAGRFAAFLLVAFFAAAFFCPVFDVFLVTFFVVVFLRPAEVFAAAAAFAVFLAGLVDDFAGSVFAVGFLAGLVVAPDIAGFFGAVPAPAPAAPLPPAADSQNLSSGDFSSAPLM